MNCSWLKKMDLRLNYMALILVILNRKIDPGRIIIALMQEQGSLIRGPQRKWTADEAERMIEMRKHGYTYAEVAEAFGLATGDAVYMVIKRYQKKGGTRHE